MTQPPELVWEDKHIGRTQSTASFKDGLVYITDGFGMLNCYNADTGEVIYRYDLDTSYIKERSQLVADGKIYISTEESVMKVLKEGPEPVLLSETQFKKHMATVDVADGLVLVQAMAATQLPKARRTDAFFTRR